MNKNYTMYVHHMLDSIRTIEAYTRNLTSVQFHKSKLVQDGVIRNLQIMGEAAKHIPKDVRRKHSEIEWRDIAGMRDILTHNYLGVDLDTIWEVIETDLPELKQKLTKVLNG